MHENMNIPDSTIQVELTFRNLCLMHMQQLTNFPYIESDFDALTDYELLCLVVKYLNDVITNSNEQNQSITNLYNAFLQLQTYMNNSVQELEDAWNDKTTELEEAWTDKTSELETAFNNLQTWINNYFDNLDVQDEINNKLDEMLEDGVLEQIIEQFLQSTALWCFDTVASMKQATNLVSGSYAKTLGYYSVNDGGSALYKITDTQSQTEFQETLSGNLYATLIIKDVANAKQFGAYGDNIHDDTQALNTMLSTLKYIYLTNGTYKTSNTITLHAYEYIQGENKDNTIIQYTGSGNCITNVDESTCTFITIQDITVLGTNRQGKGIFLQRTTKEGDTWHRLKNIIVRNFDIGIHLYNSLNEIMLNDIVSNSNNCGIKVERVNDFYMNDIVTAVNKLSGIYLLDSTEGRINNAKAWYNGQNGSSSSDKVNISIASCAAIMLNNIGCQESYFSNLRVAFSRDVSIQNCYLSKPNLDTTQAEHQILFESNISTVIECFTANTKVNDAYFNKLIEFRNKSYNCDINIKCESDYPDSLKETITDSAKGQALEVCNSIKIVNKNIRYNHNMNFALNGDLSNTNTMDMVHSGSDKLSWVNGLLRLNSGESQSGCNFKTSVLPITGCYTWYIKFKKVSGSGRVTLDYTCYADIGADDPVGTEYYASKMYVNANTDVKTNLYVRLPANTVIDIVEIGYTLGESAEVNLPLYYKAKI